MLKERLKFKVTFKTCKELAIAQKPLSGVNVGKSGCGADLNSILTLSKLNFAQTLMVFLFICVIPLVTEKTFPKAFMLIFLEDLSPKNMKNIEYMQGQSHKV